jgi:predicted TIM-barrel fold metal-dependent hydrolase
MPPGYVRRLGDLGDRVVLGADFPNIPYPYYEQLAALDRLGLGDDWLRAVLWHNGARLMGLTVDPAQSSGTTSSAALSGRRPRQLG